MESLVPVTSRVGVLTAGSREDPLNVVMVCKEAR